MLRPEALFLAVLLGTTAASAAPPGEVTAVIHAAQPYGAGTYSAFFTSIYDAELWTDAATWSMDAPFSLMLRYQMDFSSDQIVSRSKSEMKRVNRALTAPELEAYGAALSRVIPAVHPGDELTAFHQPGQPVRFFFNGKLTGEVEGASFAQDFLGIWLSPRTSAPSLRRKLLRLK